MRITIDKEIKLRIIGALRKGYLDLGELFGENALSGYHGINTELELLRTRIACKWERPVVEYKLKLFRDWLDRYGEEGFIPDDPQEILQAVRDIYRLEPAPTDTDKASFERWERILAGFPGESTLERVDRHVDHGEDYQ